MTDPAGTDFDATLQAAENTRQNAMADVGSQADADTAAIEFYRSLYAAKLAAGRDVGNELAALKRLRVSV
jgi:hypothetical protein